MSLYRYKRTTRIFHMKPDNLALSFFMLHSAQSAFPAGKSTTMRACQPQRDAGNSVGGTDSPFRHVMELESQCLTPICPTSSIWSAQWDPARKTRLKRVRPPNRSRIGRGMLPQ
jgi:hypothetical protein